MWSQAGWVGRWEGPDGATPSLGSPPPTPPPAEPRPSGPLARPRPGQQRKPACKEHLLGRRTACVCAGGLNGSGGRGGRQGLDK